MEQGTATHPGDNHCSHWAQSPQDSSTAGRWTQTQHPGTSGQGPSTLQPVIAMFFLLLSLFSSPLCCWLLPNLFWSSRMTDQVCQIWREGRNKFTHLNWYIHKISGCLYPSKTCMARWYFKKMRGGRGSSYPLPSDVVDYKFKVNLCAAVQSVTWTGLEISFPYASQIKVSLMYFSSCLWTFRVHWQWTEWFGTK